MGSLAAHDTPDEQVPIIEKVNGGVKLGEIINSSGISVRTWRLYAYFWLVCLVFPILSLLQTRPSGLPLAISIFGLVVLTVIYGWVMWPHPLEGRARTHFHPRARMIMIASLSLLTLILAVLGGSSFLWLFIGVSAIAGIALPLRQASIAVMALTLLTLALGIIFGSDAGVLLIIPLVLLVRGLGLDMIGFVRLFDALRELQFTRQELARQAVLEERLRLARDLHDLLGHTLSLIALKSELAGRLVEKDPARAGEEIRAVEHEARQALHEVRQAVAGYRQQSLTSELAGAREILAAAGIECATANTAGSLPPDLDSVLAWVVREGVTNVIRHSRAQKCWIEISSNGRSITAEVINDGYRESTRPGDRTGSGLSGLAERIDKRGGVLQSGLVPTGADRKYRLRVELPIRVKEGK